MLCFPVTQLIVFPDNRLKRDVALTSMRYFVRMSDIASLHDKLFRSIMADKTIAVDYFKTYLPAFVSQQLDFETLTQLSDVYVSGELEKYMSDLVYSCCTKDGKGEVHVSLLIEHVCVIAKITLPVKWEKTF